jgi:ribosome-associated protein
MLISPAGILREVSFKAVRSGGSGGQHVNKVSTKVALSFDIGASQRLTERQKTLLFQKLKNRISDDGILRLTCDTERSQLSNKILVFEKFLSLLDKALTPPKKRVPTRPSKQKREQRLQEKKERSEKKARRRERW